MGYFLLFEGMLDTVIYARDHYLTPGGTILPNRCTISIVGSGDTSMCYSVILTTIILATFHDERSRAYLKNNLLSSYL